MFGAATQIGEWQHTDSRADRSRHSARCRYGPGEAARVDSRGRAGASGSCDVGVFGAMIQRSDEAVAPPWERLDVAWCLRYVSKCAAELADHRIQARVEIHHALGPEQRNQMLARNDTPCVRDELLQHSRRLLLETDASTGALEVTRFRVEDPPIEAEFVAAHGGSAPGHDLLSERSAWLHGVAASHRRP